MHSDARKRKGSGEIEGLLIFLGICLVVWLVFLRPGGAPTAIQATRPVIANKQYDYNPIGDSQMVVTVRNDGGAGRVKVAVAAYRDQKGSQVIGRWSTAVYLQGGEEKKVAIPLTGLQERHGGYYDTTAEAE
jgi:hypothetical protein